MVYMDNDKQFNGNPQLRMLNNMENQNGFSNNGAVQSGSYGYPVNNFNSEINNQWQGNNQGINNLDNQNINNSYQGQGNTPVDNNLGNNINQNTVGVNNSFMDNNIGNTSNQQTGVYSSFVSPFDMANGTDPRKNAMNDNNFYGNNLEHGFVDVLKEGGVNVEIPENKFIDTDKKFNETSISDLNIDDSYNKMSSIDYRNDPQVIANLQENKKKNTVKISKELQTFFLIAMILLVFIFIMPYIFDLMRDIQSR